MARFKPQKQARYIFLIQSNFTPLEARQLSILPKKTPALQAMVADRIARRERFDQIASRKIERGQWRSRDVGQKWVNNLSRMYRKRDWRVKHGPTGAQQKMPRGAPNPWASYRHYVKDTGGIFAQGYLPIWATKAKKGQRTELDKSLLVANPRVSGASAPMIQQWIGQLDDKIKVSRGERRVQLTAQRDRLQRLI